jgi:hypothetical protein
VRRESTARRQRALAIKGCFGAVEVVIDVDLGGYADPADHFEYAFE